MTVRQLTETDKFSSAVICDGDREITGVYIGDLLSCVMGRAKSSDAWITIMSNVNILAVAALADTSCIILSEGVKLTDDVLETAKQKEINIVYTSLTTYDAAIFLNEVL